MIERASSSTWVHGLTDMFAAERLDVARLLHASGLAALRGGDAAAQRCGADSVSRLWELAVAWSGNPTLGMARDLPARHVNFDLPGHFVLSCPNLRTGLQALARYLALISDAATFALVDHGRDAWLVLGHIGNRQPVPRQRQEYGLLSLLTLCRWALRRDVHPVRAESAFVEPGVADHHHQAFGCTVQFGQVATRLLLCAADLDAPLPSRDPALLALHRGLMEQRLTAQGTSTLRQRIQELVTTRLPRGEPRRADIAAVLAMSDHTLQRRLAAEGLTYRQVLDATRQELASKYLADESQTLTTITALLGFGDSSNFFRASRRWFGRSPGEQRQCLRIDSIGPISARVSQVEPGKFPSAAAPPFALAGSVIATG